MAVTATINVSGVAALRYILVDTTTFYFTNAVDGQRLVLTLQQDGTGSRTVVSGNCPGLQAPSPTANVDSVQVLIYDAAANAWITGGSLDLAAFTITASGAIPKNAGLALIGGSGVTAATLVAPVAGPPGVGDDGLQIIVSCTTAHAHTLTTPANKINGGYDTVTFAAVGDSITLQASGGVWYVVGAHGTATLSEV
jgi:hypothetical protein